MNPWHRRDVQVRITERRIVRMPVICQNLFRSDIDALQKTVAVLSRRDLELTWFFGIRASAKNLSEGEKKSSARPRYEFGGRIEPHLV